MCLLTCGHIQHMYSWWWVGLSPETCRVKAFAKNKPQLLHHVGLIFTSLLIFLYAKNDIPTGLLNHPTQNIMVDVGSWIERLLDFLKFSRQSGPHICINLLKKLCRFLYLQIWRPVLYIPLHIPLNILCKLMACYLSSSKPGVNAHLN